MELTISNAALRIIGTWAGGTIAHGVMTSSLATRPYGKSDIVRTEHGEVYKFAERMAWCADMLSLRLSPFRCYAARTAACRL